jgi:hypothetical protein
MCNTRTTTSDHYIHKIFLISTTMKHVELNLDIPTGSNKNSFSIVTFLEAVDATTFAQNIHSDSRFVLVFSFW